jgi:phosphoserine phosphatase RsbU/P
MAMVGDAPQRGAARRRAGGGVHVGGAATRHPGGGGTGQLTTVVGCGVLIAVIVLDRLTPPSVVFIGLSVLGPLVASLRSSPPSTALLALLASVTAVFLGGMNEVIGTVDHAIRVAVVTLGGLVAVYAATQREQRQETLERMTHLVAVAQEALLRPPPPILDTVALAARYISASVESAIGGDLYETAYTPRGVRILLGDARGKGIEGLTLAAAVLAAFRELMWSLDILELAHALDERVAKEAGTEEDFVTAVLVELPPGGGVVVVNCGHHAPIRVGRAGAATALEPREPALPLGFGSRPAVERFPFDPGDRLLLFTDGLAEARDGGGRFFPLLEHVDLVSEGDLQECADALIVAALDHLPGELRDDLALVIAERLPGATALPPGP